jgi:hypothetical protein
VTDDVQDGVVLVVGREDLVAGVETERADDRVDGAGGIRHEGEVVGIGADECAEGLAGRHQRVVELTREESDGLRLHPRPQLRLDIEDVSRARSERPVVEERHPRIQLPVTREGRRHRRMMAGTLRPWAPSTPWTRSSSC